MRNKLQLLFFIGLVLLLVSSIGGCKPYTQEDLDAAREAGYSEGHFAGKAEGEDSGYSAGRTEGYKEGKAEGYKQGEEAGYTEGKTEGYEEGEIAGYDKGYSIGIEAGLGHGYTLRDPTYIEAVAFLREDKTDSNEYNTDTYNCSHFCRDVINNAEQQGLRAAIVLIQFPISTSSAGHSVIAFNTIDEGMIYFEPQYDDRVKVTIGESFAEINNYQKPPSADDTIDDIIIIW